MLRVLQWIGRVIAKGVKALDFSIMLRIDRGVHHLVVSDLSEEKRRFLALFKDHGGWACREDGLKDYAYYKDSNVRFSLEFLQSDTYWGWGVEKGPRGPEKLLFREYDYHSHATCFTPNLFVKHGKIIRDRIRKEDPCQREYRKNVRYESTCRKVKEILKRELPKRYTSDELLSLANDCIGGGQLLGKTHKFEDFAHYLAFDSGNAPQNFKALLVNFEMVPFLMGENPDIMSLVAWRLKLGK